MPLFAVPWGSLRILLVEFHERFAFYGTTYIFVVYLTDMLKVATTKANFVVNLFYFMSPLSAVGAALVADGVLGKPKVLAFGGFIYTSGLGVLLVSSLPYVWIAFPDQPSMWSYSLFYGGMTMMGLGYGMIKTCSAPLMVEQMDLTGLSETEANRAIDRLFNWLYWVINFGSLFGITICPLLRNYIGPRRHNDSEGSYGTGFWAAFLLTFVMSFLGLVVYVSGLSSYKTPPIQRGYLTAAVETLWDRIRCRQYSRASRLIKNTFYDQCDVSIDLDTAIEASKIFLFLPLFWLLSNQQSTNYVIQAKYLSRPEFLPPEMIGVVNTGTLLLFIPIYDRFIAPRLSITSIGKMVLGFVLSAVGLSCAALLQMEVLRRGSINEEGDYTLYEGFHRVPFYWQAPLYIVQSICEVLAGVTAIKLAYTLAPSSMRSVVMSFYLLSSAMASALGLAISPLCSTQNYTTLFFSFSGAMLLGAALFHFLFASYKEKERIQMARPSQETFPVEIDGPPSMNQPSSSSRTWSIISMTT